ncbi:unnamed protein product, partial [marine sediment metagenome]
RPSPGFTLTEASIKAYDAEGFEKKKEILSKARAIKRDEFPEDMLGTAVFLASEDSDFITGQAIVVDGGLVLH